MDSNGTDLIRYFHDLTPDEIIGAYNLMTPVEKAEFERILKTSPPRALMHHQTVPIWETWWEVFLLIGGRGCVRGNTKIFDPITNKENTIKELAKKGQSINVVSITPNGPLVGETDGPPFLKGRARLYEITLKSGKKISVTDQHKFLTPFCGWQPLSSLRVGSLLISGPNLPWSLVGSNESLFHSYKNDYMRRERIVSIRYIGIEDFYDMTVLKYKNYYAQGFWNHNTGKTVTGASEARRHLREFGKQARIGIGAPTNADARDTCMEGETGLYTMFPNEFVNYNRSLGEARHIGGGVVKAMGTEQPKRWNGPQWSMIWFDELALCNQASWDDANLGLRLGKRPYAVCTTTPKNRKWVKKLAFDKTTCVPQYVDGETGKWRLPTTFDNKFLPQRRVYFLKNKYGGSRLGRQELEGAFVDDIEGAMWKRDYIRLVPDIDKVPPFIRTIIAVDPAGSRARATADDNALTEDQRQNQQKNADTGLAAVSLGADGLVYVREITSGQWSPSEWAIEAIRMYYKYRADKIVAERNFGGDMVEDNLRKLDQWDKKSGRQLTGRFLPIKVVTASKGKDIRAEPVVTLYEQKRVWHMKHCPEAEDQMCAFIDADENEGADMVDALVWGVTELTGLGMESGSIIITPGDPRFNTITIVR